MKNKIYFIILFIIFVIPYHVLAMPLPSNIRNVKVKKIANIPLGTGANAGQAIEVTDKYIIITESKSDESATKSAVQVIDKSTLNVYKTLITDDLGHGNDVAYNSASNELYLLKGSNPTYLIYDANTLTAKGSKNVSSLGYISSFSYDSARNKFYLGQSSPRICYVTDSTYKQELSFDTSVPTGYASQSFEYYDNNLYYTLINLATADNSYSYTPNSIYVFNQSGDIVKNLTTTGTTTRHELEGIAVDETTGKVYFLFNYWDYNKNGNNGTSPIEVWTIDSNVNFRLNVNGGTLSSIHGSTVGQSGNYITINGSTTVLTIAHGAELPYYGLPDYNNSSQINIIRTGYHVVSGKEWKLLSGKTYHQNQIYYAGDFCNALLSDCTVDLYLNWVANTYTIKFNSNGGAGTMSNISATYDVNKNLSANTYTKSGYNFNGWNTKADGSGTTYQNKSSVKNLTTTNGGTVTLYAQWKQIPATVLSSDNNLIISQNNKIIGNVTKNANIDTLVSKLTIEGTLTKLDSSGNAITGRTTIRGGDIFRVTSGSNVSNYKILLHGDVNQDNVVNKSDVNIIARHIANKRKTLTGDNTLFADINRDGKVKMNDATKLLKEIE